MALHSEQKLVLVVDDTPTNIAVISGVLKGLYRTKIATNGEKALVLAAAAEKPDLILLDVMMPGIDGYEVCRRLKSDPATATIPVIFLTANISDDDERTGFEVGAVDYIHKPFSPPLVLARVRTHLALRDALKEAHEAREESDKLILALLPPHAAEELHLYGSVIPRRYENVAVLFADVVGFTNYCDDHEPEDVVSRLDALFVVLEQIAAEHGIEKIKTIGDAFMGVAGMLNAVDEPVHATARCGLAMAAALKNTELGWSVRVEMHAGPVVAGVVGQERYQFDVWGDTVNVAARMSAQARAAGVAVTKETWDLLAPTFEGAALGDIEIKGKGTIAVFEVLGDRALA